MESIEAPQELADIGVIGLAVMGENLALNLADHGYRVAVRTHTAGKVAKFLERNAGNPHLIGTLALEEFVAVLKPPRHLLLMIKAGDPVDEMLERLAPLLSPNDV